MRLHPGEHRRSRGGLPAEGGRHARERAGQLRDWGWAVTRIHADFGWPWPGGGAASRADSWHSGQGGASRLVEDNLRQLYIDTGPGTRGDSSGYLSRWIQCKQYFSIY